VGILDCLSLNFSRAAGLMHMSEVVLKTGAALAFKLPMMENRRRTFTFYLCFYIQALIIDHYRHNL